jgi:hypothetical protein
LQEFPVTLQLCSVDLTPRLDEALLGLREGAAEALERVDREHRRMFLLVRVEVGAVVLPTGFDEHSNDDSEEAGEFRHFILVNRSCAWSAG